MHSKHSYAWGSQYEGLLTHPLVPHIDLRVMGFEARVDLYVGGSGGFGVLLADLEEALTAETVEQVCTAEIVTVSVHRVWPGYTGFPLYSVMLDLEASREGVRDRVFAAARFVISEAERVGAADSGDCPGVGGFLQGSSLFAWALLSASVVEVSAAVQDMVDRHPAVTRVTLTLRPGVMAPVRVEVPLGSDRRVSEWVEKRLRRMRSEYELVIVEHIKE